jgi:CheY-like chemotaxis protein
MDDRLTVLVVDDDDSVREIVRDLLEGEGLSVLEAADPMAALEIAASTPRAIDLLMTDVIMPGIDGAELARRVQTVRPAIPVLYMSGSSAEELVARGVLATGTAFLAKPFGPDALLGYVRGVADRAHGARGPSSLPEPVSAEGAVAAKLAQEVAALRKRVADLETVCAEVHQREEAMRLTVMALGHELNGPLSVLASRIELMRWEAEERALPRPVLEDLAVMERHVERLGRLVKIVLDPARPTGPSARTDAHGSNGAGSGQGRVSSIAD